MPIDQSWRRRGHSPSCWRFHEQCALAAARDMVVNRVAQAKAQSQLFSAAINKLDIGIESPEVVELARRLLKDYHSHLKATARRE